MMARAGIPARGGYYQRGIAMTEFALMLPALLLVMLMMAEFGNMFADYNTLTKAVEDGARYLSNNSDTGFGTVSLDPAKVSIATNMIAYGNPGGTPPTLIYNFDPAKISVKCAYGANAGYCIAQDNVAAIEISAEHVYQPLFGLAVSNLLALFGDPGSIGITLRAMTTVAPIM